MTFLPFRSIRIYFFFQFHLTLGPLEMKNQVSIEGMDLIGGRCCDHLHIEGIMGGHFILGPPPEMPKFIRTIWGYEPLGAVTVPPLLKRGRWQETALSCSVLGFCIGYYQLLILTFFMLITLILYFPLVMGGFLFL